MTLASTLNKQNFAPYKLFPTEIQIIKNALEPRTPFHNQISIILKLNDLINLSVISIKQMLGWLEMFQI